MIVTRNKEKYSVRHRRQRININSSQRSVFFSIQITYYRRNETANEHKELSKMGIKV